MAIAQDPIGQKSVNNNSKVIAVDDAVACQKTMNDEVSLGFYTITSVYTQISLFLEDSDIQRWKVACKTWDIFQRWSVVHARAASKITQASIQQHLVQVARPYLIHISHVAKSFSSYGTVCREKKNGHQSKFIRLRETFSVLLQAFVSPV
jgi:hypothetical protein